MLILELLEWRLPFSVVTAMMEVPTIPCRWQQSHLTVPFYSIQYLGVNVTSFRYFSPFLICSYTYKFEQFQLFINHFFLSCPALE